MTLLAIDPGRSAKGEKSIGAAVFGREEIGETGREAWQELERLSLSFEELLEQLRDSILTDWHDGKPTGERWLLLGDWVIDAVVVEDFINNAQSKGGQHNGTSECIGAIEMICHLTKTPFYRQRPDALGPAKLHAPEGSYKKLKHLRHEDSAFLHGYEFLVRRGDIEVDLSSTMGS